MAHAKPPATVEIGPIVYTIGEDGKRADDANCYGFCDHEKSEIILDPKAAPSHRRVILLHEILHAIIEDCCGALKGGKQALISDTDTEEQLVHMVAPWLLETLRRNPDLVTYLLA